MPTESFGDLYYSTEDGKYVKFEGVKLVTFTSITENVIEKYTAPKIDYDSFCTSIDLILRTKHIHGMYDYLVGKPWTKAAGRWIRSGKRMAEKNRRRRLKGVMHADRAD